MNLMKKEVEECCIQLESAKVTDRKKSCSRLTDLLENEEVVTLLSGSSSISWKRVIISVQDCLRKDADRIMEEIRKKGNSNVKYPSSDLFLQVIKTAVKSAPDAINVSKLIGYIMGCMRDYQMTQCYNTLFLLVLKDSILSNSICRGRIESADWAELFKFLKKLYEDGVFEALVLKCLMLLVRWGPTSGLSPCLLREQFEFFTKLCLGIRKNSPTNVQEDVLDISFDFCRHTAKDNRVSCCKFGEDVISNLIDLYELNGREAKVKEQLVKFFLLQVTIHHPNGVLERHPCAYAHSWSTWKRNLKVVYGVVSKEINFYFMYHHKNSSFFITNGESTELLDDFSSLFVEVSRQMFASPDFDVSMSLNSSLGECSQKRQKIEVSLQAYIDNIQHTQSWLWIHIVKSVIKTYPELLYPENYLSLLQILSTIQLESNVHNVVVNVYSCLSTMLDVEDKVDTGTCRSELDNLWKTVGESTLKAFGLNQHKDATETVLSKLIDKKLIDLKIVIQTYVSRVLNISVQSIKTLDATIRHMQFVNSDIALKKELMTCILPDGQNLKDYNYLWHPPTARFLVNLTLKQWPDAIDEYEIDDRLSDKYSELKDVYFKSILEKNIIVSIKAKESNTAKKTFYLDPQSFNILTEMVRNFVESVDSQSIEKLLSITVLLINLTDCMVEYSILEETEVNDSLMMKLVEQILRYETLKTFRFYQNKSEREMKRLLNCIQILDKIFMFNGNSFLTTRVKQVVPYDLLKTVTDILGELHQGDQQRTSELKHKLKKAITKALSDFCCVSNTLNLNENQKKLLDVLSRPDYDSSIEEEYQLLLCFLNSLKYSKIGILSDIVLSNVLQSIEAACVARHHYTESAVDILNNMLYVLYPHIAAGNDVANKMSSVELLKPFYDNREEYGPEVSLALLNCIQQLIQVDPDNLFAHWSGENVVNYVPDFLCSDYQSIRFKAIETLSVFFAVMSRSKLLTDFHRQEEIFSKMYEKSRLVFDVSGEITQERRTDEIICRTASVLHTFSTLIFCNTGWIEECLYALIKLKHVKNLGSVKKILEIINNHLYGNNEDNCVEKYLDYILEKWMNEHLGINDFPFELFNCETKLEFYNKYFDTCIPILIIADRKDLITVAKDKNISEKEIVEKSSPKVFAQALCDDKENMGTVITTNKALIYYSHVIGLDGLKKCLVNHFDQLLLCIVQFLTDEKYILEKLGESVIFSQKNLSVQQFHTCLNFIKSFLCGGENIIEFLISNSSIQFERILLALKVDVYKASTTDNKIKAFHRYAVWIMTVLDCLDTKHDSHYFFIRDTIYALINLIENHKEATSFITAVVKFAGIFLRKVLPKFCSAFEDFLTFTVNSLKDFAATLSVISDECVEILHFLIVKNACHLMTAIEKLDKFPQNAKFQSIQNVHTKIKYGNTQASLVDEINFFLQHEDVSTRQDSLVHLRNILSKEKRQLKALYKELEMLGGFSEDCENSILHRLICMLAKMSCSSNETMKFEAIKCLGELGPGSLTTLALQPEKESLDIKCTPFELFTGHVLSLLTKCIVDVDITVVQAASEVFCHILNCREGKRISESELNFGYGKLDKRNFIPYLPQAKSCPGSNPTVVTNQLVTKINDEALWCANSISHKEWIVTLVTSLLESFTNKSYLPKLTSICKVSPKLCERLLPLLVNLLMFINDKTINTILSRRVNGFFSSHWNLTVPKYAAHDSVTVNKKSVKCMLNVVSFVRLQKSYAVKSKTKQPGDLELNYLKVAKAAEFCAAHFSSLQYSELWCQAKVQKLEGKKKICENSVGSTVLDFIFENEEEAVGEALQNIFRNAYKAIGDLDALPGCGVQFLLKPQFRVEHYKELGKWDQVTQFYEMEVSHGVDSARRDLMESLKKSSLYQLPLLCSKQTDESQYECLWRLGQWSIMDTSENIISAQNFDKYRFHALKSLHENNEYSFLEATKSQGLCVIEHIRHTSLESSQNVYPILAQLQALNELEDFAKAMTSKDMISVLNKWMLQDELIKTNDFHYIEPIMAQRTVMVIDYLKTHCNNTLKNYLVEMLLDFADLAKREGQFHVASKNLRQLELMSDLAEDVKTRIQLIDAQISWSVNDKLVARHILNNVSKNDNNVKLQAAALNLSGQYMSETFSGNRMKIINDYFENVLDTYDKIAQFADEGYQQIVTYMKSDLFQRKIVNMEKSKETASKMQKQNKKTKDECIAASMHNKQSNIDANEINSTKQEMNHFLKIALRYYFKNLKLADKNNIRIFRIMALLLENRNNSNITTWGEILPSYKYITVLPQLIPHITENNTDSYSKMVNEIVEKCAIEHPYHTLPLLLSLANAHKDRKFSDSKTKTFSNDSRMEAACNLIKKLKRNGDLCAHIDKLQQLCQALIELAYYKNPDMDDMQKAFDIPKNQKILKIKNWDDILLPTYSLGVSKSGNYTNIVGITTFGTVYHPVGGVNQPKRITCQGTDGKIRSQLVKGEDDIRQDAVMQQVFTIMNNLLSVNKQTKNLLIRTYKIVPLSMRSGILEWVDNSMRIGDYLVGTNKMVGAHQMYRPGDKSSSSCRQLIKTVATKSSEERLATFKSICQKFKPVFHKFFEVSFPHAPVWYERRRAYIHSVATTSMCGYILGIGDRHLSNILIDTTTAEVIHIDFGIAFEQGKCLPTPETVPFRLTRDIVDGMGVSGVEGIFRRSCEKTMEVLRQNAQTIITILEVLLYDPLYVWTVTSAEANKRQTDDEIDLRNLSDSEEERTPVNITAERALLRLREKLQGTELGHPASIEHQVGTLIQQALDPANLCKLFCGWQAYV
ncbi:hypothetical protein NQ315_010763 [Exocentrus adspersus]|uniref:Serine/threonine-protein kinase ATM n=1 Tax=Exocentrus adspersus TaxID=1586481 RepID=A0AAV8VUP7_9CUCU|nr:hypothetical protein NQ315_010763 [Exocentrus adspersus]